MVDFSKPVQTRDGRKAIVVGTNFNFKGGESVLAVITQNSGFQVSRMYYQEGQFIKSGLSGTDLINIPQPRKHADIIKAWADGAEVQIRGGVLGAKWQDCEQPSFCNCMEYRVKP